MATAESGGRGGAAAFLAHRMPALLVLLILLDMPAWFDMPTSLRVYTDLPSFALVFVVFGSLAHAPRRPMCTGCAEIVPTDPQRAIERNAWPLWLSHVLDEHPLGVWVYLFCGALATGALVHFTGVNPLYMPYDLSVMAICYSTWRHHYLIPWCPRCREWGDGGDPEFVPDPDPVERGTR